MGDKNDKKENLLVNLVLFIIFYMIVYYTVINPDDFAIHMGMLETALRGLSR